MPTITATPWAAAIQRRRFDPGLRCSMGSPRHPSPCCRPGDGANRSLQSDDERKATAHRALRRLFLRVQLSRAADEAPHRYATSDGGMDGTSAPPGRLGTARHIAQHHATQRDGRTWKVRPSPLSARHGSLQPDVIEERRPSANKGAFRYRRSRVLLIRHAGLLMACSMACFKKAAFAMT